MDLDIVSHGIDSCQIGIDFSRNHLTADLKKAEVISFPITERYASNGKNQPLSKHEETTDKTDRSYLAKFGPT